jgi:hypothetical protein
MVHSEYLRSSAPLWQANLDRKARREWALKLMSAWFKSGWVFRSSPALAKIDIFFHSPRLCGQLGLALAKRLRKAYQFLPQIGAFFMLHHDFRHQGR